MHSCIYKKGCLLLVYREGFFHVSYDEMTPDTESIRGQIKLWFLRYTRCNVARFHEQPTLLRNIIHGEAFESSINSHALRRWWLREFSVRCSFMLDFVGGWAIMRHKLTPGF